MSLSASQFEAMARRIRTRKSGRASASVFSLFFSGKYSEALRLFDALNPEALTDEDRHLAFACLVALGLDTTRVQAHLPTPLSFEEFERELANQLQMEAATKRLGVLNQPVHVHKSLLAASVGLHYGKDYFIETGTYVGMSILKISRLFKRLLTVEADPFLYQAASALFGAMGTTNVAASLGDSRTFLESVPSEIGDQSIFFLDAHYSTGITSRQYGACPVVDEISVIVGRAPRAVIVVDDIRTMTGRRGYPTLPDILRVVPTSYFAKIQLDQLILFNTEGKFD